MRIFSILFLLIGVGVLACSTDDGTFPSSFMRHDANPILSPDFEWEGDWVHPYSVLRVGDEYWMWYGGIGGSMPNSVGLAFSDDGLSWHRYEDNPIFLPRPDAWDSLQLSHLTVIQEDSRFLAWYAGDPDNDRYLDFRIGYAESADGISWSRSSEPVIDLGPPGSWDSHFVVPAAVLHEESEYRMYYWGVSDPNDFRTWKMGLATSRDGLHWQKHAENPIFEGRPDSWEAGVLDMDIKKVGDVYYLVYQGNDVFNSPDRTRVGLAKSLDGIHWQRAREEPFFDNGTPESWDGQWTEGPTLLQVDDGWLMYYMGKPFDGAPQIGVALALE